MYTSNSMQSITQDPKKTSCPNIVEFINDTCRFYPGGEMITEEIYDKYVQYCKDRNLEFSIFNVFARSFRYYAFHNNMIPNMMVHRVNYTHYKDGVGYIRKSGWAYSNICVSDKPLSQQLIKPNKEILQEPLISIEEDNKLIIPSIIQDW